MKRLAYIGLLFVCSVVSIAQTDTIYTNFKTIPCTITRINDMTIYYKENNESKTLAREKVKRIAAHSYDLPDKKKSKFNVTFGDTVIDCKVRIIQHTFPVSKEYKSNFEILQGTLFPVFTIDLSKTMNIIDTTYFMDIYYHHPIIFKFRDTTRYRKTDLDTLICYQSLKSGENCFSDFKFFPEVIYFNDQAKMLTTAGIIYNATMSSTGYYYEAHYQVKISPKEIEAIMNREVMTFKVSQYVQKLTSDEVKRLRNAMICLLKTKG